MFSFHKPKIYRSLQGCCICRAKSSSSRFTDSKRYERDFEKCFEIADMRSGEICNACVLLVKRWKKLPAGSTRNWRHVVDARAGPGTKSMSKIKNKAAGTNKTDQLKDERFKKKHKHKHHKKHQLMRQVQKQALNAIVKPPSSPSTFSDDIGDDCMSEDRFSNCDGDYLSNSDASDDEDSTARSNTRSQSSNKTGSSRRKSPNPLHFSSFLDLSYWKKTEICCGIIFKGSNGEVLIDPSLMHPCRTCNKNTDTRKPRQLSESNDSCQSDSFMSSQDLVSSQQQQRAFLPALHSHHNTTARKSQQPTLTSKTHPAFMTIGGSADTNPPAPVEVEPMLDQAPALSPVSAHTPSMYTEEDDDYSPLMARHHHRSAPILDYSLPQSTNPHSAYITQLAQSQGGARYLPMEV